MNPADWLNLDPSAALPIFIALIGLAGIGVARLTKLFHLPNAVGYILAGVIIGPCALNLIPAWVPTRIDVIPDMALAFWGFSAGRPIRRHFPLRRRRFIAFALCQSLACCAAIAAMLHYGLRIPALCALTMGAIGSVSASAFASTHDLTPLAKGGFADISIPVSLLNNACALVAFRVAATVSNAVHAGTMQSKGVVFAPLLYEIASIALGIVLALALRLLMRERRDKERDLTPLLASLLIMVGFCAIFKIPPLMGAMAMGMVYANTRADQGVFSRLDRACAPLILLFYALAGMSLNVRLIPAVWIAGLCYLAARVVVQFIGAHWGGALCGVAPPERNQLGLALIPQAGVPIGLAIYAARLLPQMQGQWAYTIVLCCSALLEWIDPIRHWTAFVRTRSRQGRSGEKHLDIPAIFQASSGLSKHEDIVYIADEPKKPSSTDDSAETAESASHIHTIRHESDEP